MSRTEYAREWYRQKRAEDPEGWAEHQRRVRLKCRYGITPEEYEEMHERQRGVCAICGRAEKRRLNGRVTRLSVDHDHETGRVRGLLCWACNRAIGLLQEDRRVLEHAISYLSRS